MTPSVLTSMQERGPFGSLPLALLTPAIGPSAIALNALVAAIPNAAGRQVIIEAFNGTSEQMNWVQRNNIFNATPVSLHGMDYVMRGIYVGFCV